ncbi:glycerate kinase [Galdieria sulphuraria]|uniref:Glycerate kinase n=1 Tax=Galdieria sulphuraria TaxID=130081 RepID=M2XRC5_GALSU|nr:glycerate kinase [Galdieria sulphuraria]EME32792.1 glycerate kinase [Galdieria sulphuraria]|eukprot:XP_005709312.1 glycerate kinase [Galdieria sulphuraria]
MNGSYCGQQTTAEIPKDCILSSPVFQATGLLWQDIPQKEWGRLANLLIQKLKLDPTLPETNVRIHQLYLPIFFWLKKVCDQQKSGAPIVGISCPQGGGKTTLTFAVQFLFQQLQRKCAVASIDDFYITRKEQQMLFERERNPLLEFRGNPGTHDVELGVQVLSQLKSCKANERVAIPRYDKAAWNGLGDRFPIDEWYAVECPVDLILLEGWCLGFQPVREEELIDSRLGSINNRLGAYQKWYDMLDGWLVIEIEDLNWIYDWRAQAEDMLRMQNRGAMTPEQVRDFVSRFMPAYQQYLFRFYRSPLLTSEQNRLQFRIDKKRQPISSSKY